MAVPSEDHLLAFGRIMHNYATVEAGIKIALSGIMELRLSNAMIAFQPYGALDLKNVAKSIAKERLKPDLAEKFCWIIGEWAKHNAIRNTIAHNKWTDGQRPNSIRPRYVSIREGRAAWFGDELEEADYTAAELEGVAAAIAETNERLKSFLQTSGLNKIIEAKIADESA